MPAAEAVVAKIRARRQVSPPVDSYVNLTSKTLELELVGHPNKFVRVPRCGHTLRTHVSKCVSVGTEPAIVEDDDGEAITRAVDIRSLPNDERIVGSLARVRRSCHSGIIVSIRVARFFESIRDDAERAKLTDALGLVEDAPDDESIDDKVPRRRPIAIYVANTSADSRIRESAHYLAVRSLLRASVTL